MMSVSAAIPMDYKTALPLLTPQLLSVRDHQELLKSLSHRLLEDMAVVYRMELCRGKNHTAFLLVTESMRVSMEVSLEKLHSDVLEQTFRMHPPALHRLRDLLSPVAFCLPPAEGPELYAASTADGRCGASVILCPGFLQRAGEELGGDYFLLPSSIHEFLLLRDDGDFSPDALRQMVISINHTQVAPQDRLTDSVYRYSPKTGSFTRAAGDPVPPLPRE